MRTFDERRESVQNYMEKIKKQRRRTITAVTSACLVVAVLAMVLFIPYDTTPPDVSMYAGSDYYNLIQRLNEATYDKPEYKNNFEALVDNLDFGIKGGNVTMDGMNSALPMAPGAPSYGMAGESGNAGDDYASSTEKGDQYQETTDNQVAGVIEGDLLKRSDKYAFYLRGMTLAVYSIEGENSQLVGEYAVRHEPTQDEIDQFGRFSYYSCTEMYLSMDCKTITILITGFGKNVGNCTTMVSLDVSDPTKITEKNRVYFNGGYVSSRMVDGDILLTYNYRVYSGNIDFDNPKTFVPRYGSLEDMPCISSENIICPENVSSTAYTVICKVNGESLEVDGSVALLSYAQELYVSEDTIYATHSYTEKNQEIFNNEYRQKTMTEITGISYAGDSLEILGTIAVEGSVKNQYSMDQYEGILRVVTSTTVSYFKETFYGEFASSTTSATDRNVNLYCVNLYDWTVKASVIAFAPEGEDAQSVRFDGHNAYVCTAEVITIKDPVYFFDLSDLENITWKDTGTIDGYSTSLINLGDGYLLGIGYGDARQLKIEVYEEAEAGVCSVASWEIDASFSLRYKSYFIDREKDLIGLAIRDYWQGSRYVLLHFNGDKLQVVQDIPLGNYATTDAARAFLKDGWLYVFCNGIENNFFVTKIA